MPIAAEIGSLEKLVERLRIEGFPVAHEIVQQMHAVESDARVSSFDDLARLCCVGAETIQLLAANAATFAPQAEHVLDHLTRVIDFANKCAEAAHAGASAAGIVPPPLLTLPNNDEETHFAETVSMFISHSIGVMSELEEEVLAVESSTKPEETISGIRRTMHTLKAEFGVLNMDGPQKLCHQAETTIDACVENGHGFPVEVMLQCIDLLKQFFDRLTRDISSTFGDAAPMIASLQRIAAEANKAATIVEEVGPPVVLTVGGEFADNLTEFITEARSHLADAEVAMVRLGAEPGKLEHINVTFRAFHTIKGVAGFLNLTPLVELAHVAETLLDGARSGRLTFSAADIDLVLAAGDMITQMLAALEGQPGPSTGHWKNLKARLQAAAVGTHQAAPGGKVTPAAAPAVPVAQPQPPMPDETTANDKVEAEAGPVMQPKPTAEATAAVGGEHKAARVDRTIKVSTTRLDMLVDMVGELVIAQSMVLQDPAIQRLDCQSLTRNIGQVGKITRDLQEAAMSLRMVTVKSTFQKMSRLVRDVAGKSGKRVALTLAGEETELDRNVVEQISDPLVHMIRNAIDHGIETPDNRRSKGKHHEGHLSLSAYHQGGSIVIEIRDDGSGIDKARVIKKAVEKGLLPPDSTVNNLSDSEAFALIFLPGFSTAEKVTDLSGRGVGMDVVRRNIEALRGKIEIDSRLGEGTTFRLRLPLTLAIIDGMIVRVGNNRYVIPTLSIEQSFRPQAADVHHLVDRGECVHVRGTVLPIYRLKGIFGQSDGLDDIAEGILIVVELNGQRSCLFVDEILGQQQVVIKSLGLQRDRAVGLSGGAIMTDGRVALILDVGTLVESAFSF